MKDREPPHIGKHTLETLTTGMYKDPCDAIREYVQNAADSLEKWVASGHVSLDDSEVRIDIDPRSRSISVRDSGVGLTRRQAQTVLRSIGSSDKLGESFRGFRGIGRLGGLGYCDEMLFRTKAIGEGKVSVQRWDAAALREHMRSRSRDGMSMADVIDEVSGDYVEDFSGDLGEHFFEVIMKGVHEPRLLDISAVSTYLSESVPVPFDFQAFSFAKEIDQYLKRTVNRHYATFRVMVGQDVIYKPYRDTIPLSRAPNRAANAECQRIKGIEYVTLSDAEDAVLAYCWLGEVDFKGTVSPDAGVSGVRFRSGNMLIGDGSALEPTFQKSNRRFASYLVGEIHVVHEGLVPNARRDDFESNAVRHRLFEAIAKRIAHPATEAIRKASKVRSEDKKVQQAERIRNDAEREAQRGVVAESRRADLTTAIRESIEDLASDNPEQAVEAKRLESTLVRIEREAANVVDAELQSSFSKPVRDALKAVFEMVYEELEDKVRAERLIRKIVSRLKSA